MKQFMYCFRDDPWKMGVVLAETYVDACSKLMNKYKAGIVNVNEILENGYNENGIQAFCEHYKVIDDGLD